MEREIFSLRANLESTSKKSPDRRLLSDKQLAIGLSAAIAIGLAWRNHQANLQRIAESERPTVLKTRRKRPELANTLALLTLSLGASLLSAGDSSAQHVIENNPRVVDTDRSNPNEIEIANAVTLEMPSKLDFASIATPVQQSAVEPFTPTMQPIGIPSLVVTEAIEAKVNSEPIKVEMHSCPTGWPLESGEISQGPLGGTSHYRLYPSERAIDIAADTGSAVFATFDGQVVTVNFDITNNYGIYVDVKGECNGVPFTARWAHLSAVADDVVAGVEVANRQVVGAVGNTGRSDGAHLHYAFFNLEMAAPNVPLTVVSYECDSDSQIKCGVVW